MLAMPMQSWLSASRCLHDFRAHMTGTWRGRSKPAQPARRLGRHGDAGQIRRSGALRMKVDAATRACVACAPTEQNATHLARERTPSARFDLLHFTLAPRAVRHVAAPSPVVRGLWHRVATAQARGRHRSRHPSHQKQVRCRDARYRARALRSRIAAMATRDAPTCTRNRQPHRNTRPGARAIWSHCVTALAFPFVPNLRHSEDWKCR